MNEYSYERLLLKRGKGQFSDYHTLDKFKQTKVITYQNSFPPRQTECHVKVFKDILHDANWRPTSQS